MATVFLPDAHFSLVLTLNEFKIPQKNCRKRVFQRSVDCNMNRAYTKQIVVRCIPVPRGSEMKSAETVSSRVEVGGYSTKALLTSWLLALIAGCSLMAGAQTPADEKNTPASSPKPEVQSAKPEEQSPEFSRDSIRLKSFPRNLFLDQKSFWSTPFHMTKKEWQWTVPLAFAGAALLASDTAIEKHVPMSPTTVSHAVTASNAGLAAFASAGAGMFLWGHLAHNDDARETGLLSGEAGIDAFLDTEVLKYATGRDRPFVGDGRGRFFQGGDSFPSQHAAISWAIASVIAHEYPGPLTQFLVYGLAGGVSAARFAGQKHFASDVLVGSAIGWYTGRQVFRSHSHYSSADIAKYGTFSKGVEGNEADTGREPRNMGSSYVPLDSWVYPVFDRLIAIGYVHDRTGSIRPWSRLECARILAEVHQHLADEPESYDAHIISLVRDLDTEFAPETQLRNGDTPNVNAELESVYSRYTDISGPPLRDSFHFAQTIADDFGRPYGRGSNNITGFSSNAAVGPFLVYVRGEYQYGSSSQEYTTAQAQDIANSDGLPVNSVPTFGQTSRLRSVEAYAGLNLANWQLTFGQQSLWWGANRSTSILLSNNAEAMPMLRLDRVSPLQLPLLGPVYVSGFLGRIGGTKYLRLGPDFVLYGDGIHDVNPQPYVWGANIAFKPTSNLELGFSLTTIFAGHGRPLTLQTFFHTFSQHGNLQPVDPGGRRPTMSASYRLPGLRNSVLLYADALSEAQPLPLLYPTQSGLNAGIYLSRLPRLKNFDFRCEGIYTNMPGNATNNLFYVNFHYPNGYRNYNQIMGSWIGRGGNGGQASTTYWFSGHNQATLTYRRMVTDQSLLKGGNVNDISGGLTWMLRPHIQVVGSLQYERWNFAELNPGPRSNLATTIEIQVWPKLRAAATPTATSP
jgi:membrane-associated phospholipid phosphatase